MELVYLPKTGTGLSCIICKIPIKLSLSFERKPGMALVLNSHSRSGIKIDASEKFTFFPCKNFHQNELFPLEFVPESGVDHYRAFHTKGVKLSARSFQHTRLKNGPICPSGSSVNACKGSLRSFLKIFCSKKQKYFFSLKLYRIFLDFSPGSYLQGQPSPTFL